AETHSRHLPAVVVASRRFTAGDGQTTASQPLLAGWREVPISRGAVPLSTCSTLPASETTGMFSAHRFAPTSPWMPWRWRCGAARPRSQCFVHHSDQGLRYLVNRTSERL